jgi:hypothetical protein
LSRSGQKHNIKFFVQIWTKTQHQVFGPDLDKKQHQVVCPDLDKKQHQVFVQIWTKNYKKDNIKFLSRSGQTLDVVFFDQIWTKT